ncbi:nuclease [Magnetospirillum sp. 64-120]|uniref:nuclease n=1 Tax=Magnetospirillum sp. 64-120 TaxID=1895778 RepID=UPI0025BF9EE5|nr:nuclease [Magnetospirillum sp. 64-120]
MRATIPLVATVLLAAQPALSAPIRCSDDGEGGACVWGRVEGYDGSSVQIRGLTIQLAGIVVPPRRDLCQDKAAKTSFDCAKPARKRMGELLSKGVACDILDVAGGVIWGRCTVADGDLGAALVVSGVAKAAKDSPYDTEQAAALAAKKGLWAAGTVIPKDWENIRKKGE